MSLDFMIFKALGLRDVAAVVLTLEYMALRNTFVRKSSFKSPLTPEGNFQIVHLNKACT